MKFKLLDSVVLTRDDEGLGQTCREEIGVNGAG